MVKIPFLESKKIKTKSFFDLRSSDKKKIIEKAVYESTKKQVKLLKECGYVFGN